jgi:TfoX/Sxy family transcriptional regulator of competence genes
MAYDKDLAERIRQCLLSIPDLSEKKMFGGVGFLINGNMTIAASAQGGILIRIDPSRTESLLETTHAQPMVMRGKSMTGWLRVSADELRSDNELNKWVIRSTAYAQTLPPKH